MRQRGGGDGRGSFLGGRRNAHGWEDVGSREGY